VSTRRRLVLAAALVAAAVIGFSIGKIATAPAAEASAAHRYTLRVGDKVTIPAVKQRCAVYTEGGAPELYCARQLHPRHQVTIFRDSIVIWKVGNPDRPAWSGKP
jgi:predicted lipoprotein